MHTLTLTKEEYDYLYNLNPEIQQYIKDFYEFDSVECVRVDWRSYPVKKTYRVVYITKEGIEKILYYLPSEHYLRKIIQGYVDFLISINEWR